MQEGTDLLNSAAGEILGQLKSSKEQAIAHFFEVFSDTIYSFPVRYYNFSEDEAGDFYLYAFEHLRDGKKLNSFQGKSKFTTWLHSVLRNLTIDFLRAHREKLKTTQVMRIDSRGNLIDAMDTLSRENPDDENRSFEEELFSKFSEALHSLKINQRILFKLAYIHFIDLNREELEWLAAQNKTGIPGIQKQIDQIKDLVLEKEGDIREMENKITLTFQHILSLEESIQSYFQQHPDIDPRKEDWNEDFSDPMIDLLVTEKIQSLVKKKKKHANLLAQQKKGLLSVRVPYKEIAELMGSSKGVLSVQLLRIIEKLNQGLENNGKS